MSAIGRCVYWAALIAAYIQDNWWRGRNQLYRMDYSGPRKWGKD